MVRKDHPRSGKQTVKTLAYPMFLSLVLWPACVRAAFAQEKPPVQEAKKPAAQVPKPAPKEAVEEKIPEPGPDALFPAVVARVNGKPLLGRDLEQRIREELLGIGSPSWKNLREDYRKELIDRHMTSMIGSELLYQNAAAMGIQATEAEIQAEFENVAKNAGGDAALNTELAGRGMDRADLRKEIEKSLVVNKFIREHIDKKIAVTPAEVADYFAKHPDEFKHGDIIRTSHILIAVAPNASAEQEAAARKRAEDLLLRLRKGEDFAKLARENSMDDSASAGGDIGYTEKGQLDPAYENAAWSLAVGQTSGLIRSSFGYHIIKVTDKKKAGQATLEEVRAQLTDFLREQKRTAELDKLIKDLRDKAKITITLSGPNGSGS